MHPAPSRSPLSRFAKRGGGRGGGGGGGAPGRENGKWEERDREEEVCQVHSFTNATQPALLLIRVRPNPRRPILYYARWGAKVWGGILLRKVGPQEKGSNIKRQIDRYRLLLLGPTVVLVSLPRFSGAPSKEKSGGGTNCICKRPLASLRKRAEMIHSSGGGGAFLRLFCNQSASPNRQIERIFFILL